MGLRRIVAAILAAGAVSAVGVVSAPAAWAGSCDGAAAPECAAVLNLLAGGTESGAVVTTTAAGVAATPVAAAGVNWGAATGTGLVLAAGAGFALSPAGITPWEWSPGADVPPEVPGYEAAGGASGVYGDYTVEAGADLSGGASSADPLTFTSLTNQAVAYRKAWMFCRSAGSASWTPGSVYALVKAVTAHTAVSPSLPGWTGTFTLAANQTGTTWGNLYANCGAGNVMGAVAFYRSASGTASLRTLADPVGVIVPDWVATAPATDPYPGRTIEQTVTCSTRDGDSYVKTQSTDLSGAIVAGVPVTIAGLMCDPAELASDGSAVIKSPGKPDYTLSQNPSVTAPRWGLLPTPSRFDAVDPTREVIWTFAPEPPGSEPIPPLVEPVTDVQPPGVPTEDGTAFCGMTFGDILNGAVMFKAVGCALSWAFVPSSSAMAVEVAEMKSAWNGSRVGQLVAPVAEFPSAFASWGSRENSCEGPTFTIPITEPPTTIQPLNACAEPMETVAFWVKLAITGLLIWAGMTMVLNPILLAMGLNALPEVRGFEDDGQGRLF